MSARITSRDVKSAIQRAAEPMDWVTLKGQFDTSGRGSVRALRQLLKGMLRSGELEMDHGGCYHLPNTGEVVEGVVVQEGRGLFVEGHPVAEARRKRVRVGDRVRGRLKDAQIQIVEVLSHSEALVVGELNWLGRYPYVEAVAGNKGRIELEVPPVVGQHGDIVKVRIQGESRKGLSGEVVELVEGSTVLARAVEAHLSGAHIPRTFGAEALGQVSGLPKRVSNRVPAKRRDLRDTPFVTIDGETAKDFDDAVFAEPLGNGWMLKVAIADVAHYVKKGSALDEEAYLRGNSVYLPQTVVPMLPEELSNELCSLKPEVPRYVLVCEMHVDASGQVTQFDFCEAVIRSWRRLTYTQVAAYLDGGSLLADGQTAEPEVLQSLQALHRCFAALSQERERRGALDFESHEAILELERGSVTAIHPVQRNDAHRLIEEAMIAANVCAAQYLHANGVDALFRNHPLPEVLQVETLQSAFAMAGVQLRGKFEPKALQTALAALRERDDAWIFQMMVLRAMQQALYQPANVGHFGLALAEYMHFTSPIRRYADLVVHRTIKSVLKGARAPYKKDDLEDIGAHISHTERRAEQAEWGVEGWLKCDFLLARVGDTLAGRIASVTEFGLFVELDGYYVQGLVHVSELGDDFFRFQAANLTLVGERSGQTFRMGDEVMVRIREIRPPLGRIDLEIQGRRGGGQKRGRRRRR